VKKSYRVLECWSDGFITSLIQQSKPQLGQAGTKKENQKRTQRREAAKNPQSFSLRSLCVSASLRESFCFFAMIPFLMD
jgi:hypothetical protein